MPSRRLAQDLHVELTANICLTSSGFVFGNIFGLFWPFFVQTNLSRSIHFGRSTSDAIKEHILHVTWTWLVNVRNKSRCLLFVRSKELKFNFVAFGRRVVDNQFDKKTLSINLWKGWDLLSKSGTGSREWWSRYFRGGQNRVSRTCLIRLELILAILKNITEECRGRGKILWIFMARWRSWLDCLLPKLSIHEPTGQSMTPRQRQSMFPKKCLEERVPAQFR